MSEEIKEIEQYLKKCSNCFTCNAFLGEDENGGHCMLQNAFNYITNLQNQLQQKENIIKEVREKLCKYGLVDKEGNFNAYLDTVELKELLEILDKENK